MLCGGPSQGRKISLSSGKAVANACDELGYRAIVADIGPGHLQALRQEIDVVFPVLHGEFGEDGQVQRILEEREICFVGSDSCSSRLAFDKPQAKREFEEAGVPTPPGIVVDDKIAQLPHGSRFCCKPAQQGSSIGVEFVDSLESANIVIERIVKRFGGQVILEEFVDGRELTVGILDGKALPIVEVCAAADFYDFAAKYSRSDTRYICPADIDFDLAERIKNLSVKAFDEIGCRDYGRVDLILTPDGRPYFLEINSIPGFTPTSLLPKAAKKAGFSFNQLVDRLIGIAMNRIQNP